MSLVMRNSIFALGFGFETLDGFAHDIEQVNGTSSMSRLPASIFVMTSRSSSSPTSARRFWPPSIEIRLISGSHAPFQQGEDEALDVEMGVFNSWARLPMNSFRNVSVSRRLVISSI